MTGRTCRGAAIAICAVAGALCGGAVVAQPAADFYKGATVTLLVGSGAGGGYDVFSRVLARHMGRYIPGKPNIIVQNMQGSGSIKAAQYLYNAAPKDGSIFGAMFNTLPLQPLVRKKKLRFDLMKFNWIGSMGKHQNICVTWAAGPIKSFEQAKKRQVVVAATGASGNAAVYPKIFNEVLGTKFKVVTGYKTTGARLAVERGEADGICGMSYQTLLAADPSWILKKKVNVLLQIGLRPYPALAGVPMALDMFKKKADRDMLTFLMIPQEMGRPYVAPPGVPADRLAALRSAFMATMTDKGFLADAERTKLKLDPIGHKEVESLIARLYAMPKSTIARAANLLTAKKKKK